MEEAADLMVDAFQNNLPFKISNELKKFNKSAWFQSQLRESRVSSHTEKL